MFTAFWSDSESGGLSISLRVASDIFAPSELTETERSGDCDESDFIDELIDDDSDIDIELTDVKV